MRFIFQILEFKKNIFLEVFEMHEFEILKKSDFNFSGKLQISKRNLVKRYYTDVNIPTREDWIK